MSDRRKIYWDSSCFICFLNRSEAARRRICEDILHHAQDRKIEIWTSVWTIVEVVRPHRSSLPASNKLTPAQIVQIQGMFEWDWLKKVQVDQIIAAKAVELQRDYNLRAGDSIHAATAIRIKAEVLQRWDRDFNKINHIILSEDPKMLTVQGELIEGFRRQIGPSPENVKP